MREFMTKIGYTDDSGKQHWVMQSLDPIHLEAGSLPYEYIASLANRMTCTMIRNTALLHDFNKDTLRRSAEDAIRAYRQGHSGNKYVSVYEEETAAIPIIEPYINPLTAHSPAPTCRMRTFFIETVDRHGDTIGHLAFVNKEDIYPVAFLIA